MLPEGVTEGVPWGVAKGVAPGVVAGVTDGEMAGQRKPLPDPTSSLGDEVVALTSPNRSSRSLSLKYPSSIPSSPSRMKLTARWRTLPAMMSESLSEKGVSRPPPLPRGPGASDPTLLPPPPLPMPRPEGSQAPWNSSGYASSSISSPPKMIPPSPFRAGDVGEAGLGGCWAKCPSTGGGDGTEEASGRADAAAAPAVSLDSIVSVDCDEGRREKCALISSSASSASCGPACQALKLTLCLSLRRFRWCQASCSLL